MAITANSYMDTTELDTILTNNIDAGTTWSALSDANKDKYINWAMYILDSQQWLGVKYDLVTPQDLEWPRTFEDDINSGQYGGIQYDKLKDNDDNLPDIPRNIQLAEVEILIQKLAYDTKDFESVRRAEVEQFSLGRNALNFKFWDNSQNFLISPQAKDLCQWYLIDSNTSLLMTQRI